jgi:hypothetical protein
MAVRQPQELSCLREVLVWAGRCPHLQNSLPRTIDTNQLFRSSRMPQPIKVTALWSQPSALCAHMRAEPLRSGVSRLAGPEIISFPVHSQRKLLRMKKTPRRTQRLYVADGIWSRRRRVIPADYYLHSASWCALFWSGFGIQQRTYLV